MLSLFSWILPWSKSQKANNDIKDLDNSEKLEIIISEPVIACEEKSINKLPPIYTEQNHLSHDKNETSRCIILYGGSYMCRMFALNIATKLSCEVSVDSMNDYMKKDSDFSKLRNADVVILIYEPVWDEPPENATWFMRTLMSLQLQKQHNALRGPVFFTIEFTTRNELYNIIKLLESLGTRSGSITWTKKLPMDKNEEALLIEDVYTEYIKASPVVGKFKNKIITI